MSRLARVSFCGEYIGTYSIDKLKRINSNLFKECYWFVFKIMFREVVKDEFDRMMGFVSRVGRAGGKYPRLYKGYSEAMEISNQIDDNDTLRMLSFSVLDRLLEAIGKNGERKGYGWWRILEDKRDEIVNNRYSFVPSNVGKLEEGFLVERTGENVNMKPHKYSIKDKRFITRFVKNVSTNTLDNEDFMDSVMRSAVLLMIKKIEEV
jgi:hypothetical protein